MDSKIRQQLTEKIPELLPSNTRAVQVTPSLASYYKDYPAINYLVEVPPKIATMNFGSNGFRSQVAKPVETEEVALPWQYFIFSKIYTLGWGNTLAFSHTELYLLWSKIAIKSLDEELIAGRVPDIEFGRNAWVCLGYLDKGESTINDTVKKILSVFYNFAQGTNLHGGYHLPTTYPTLKDWAAASKKDPYCYLGWPDWETEPKLPLRKYFPKQEEVGAAK